jgi:hypothetical protein
MLPMMCDQLPCEHRVRIVIQPRPATMLAGMTDCGDERFTAGQLQREHQRIGRDDDRGDERKAR